VLGDTSWTITHAPTGLNTGTHARKCATARAAAKELAATLPDYQTLSSVGEDANAIIGLLRNHGLEIYRV